ncbi:MAG: DUF5985 family protein [Myxococcota bacterium]
MIFNGLILGATAMGALCVALFFIRFWRDSHDVFHALFAASFLLLGAQRLALAAWEHPNEAHPALYVLRLFAYMLIIAAIVGKNARPARG